MSAAAMPAAASPLLASVSQAMNRPGDWGTGLAAASASSQARIASKAASSRLWASFSASDAPGDDIVLLEHLLNRAGLFARKLPVDIGYEQFVTEFGHVGGPSG